MRYRYVGADTSPVLGVYGETLGLGYDYRARLELGLRYKFTDDFRAGAALRLSNELSNSDLPPPDLLSSLPIAGWWWAQYERGILNATAGVYDASFTPLTLMRWDLADNPLGTGGSCCAVSVAGLSQYSLEELVPDYKLEGAHVTLTPGPVTATLLFAQTAMAQETKTFAQYLGGARLTWGFTNPWTRTGGTISANALRAADDSRTAAATEHPPLRSDVAGADADIPLVGALALDAEYAYSLRNDNTRLANPDVDDYGLLAGFRYGDRDRQDIQLTFMRTNPNFNPLFRALSYARDRQGIRASVNLRRMAVGTMTGNVTLFAKYLREIRALPGQLPGRRRRGPSGSDQGRHSGHRRRVSPQSPHRRSAHAGL